MDLPSCRLEKRCFRFNAYAANRKVSCFTVLYLFMAMPPLRSQDLQPLHLELHSAGEDAAAYSMHTAELPSPFVHGHTDVVDSVRIRACVMAAPRYTKMCWDLAFDSMQ
jgi:hypothetical protein